MSVDVFGRTLVRAKEVHQGPAGIGFVLTEGGDFDIEKRRLCTVGPAVEPSDAINLENLKTIQENLKTIDEKIKKLAIALNFLQAKLVGVINDIIRQISQNGEDIITPELFQIL